MKKLLTTLLITMMIFVTGFSTVNAASVPSSITVSSMGKYNYGGTYYFPIKYTSNGNVAYCIEFKKIFPTGQTMTSPNKIDNGLLYILDNGYKGTKADMNTEANRKQYYITQLAIYTYLGQANPNKSNDIHKAVWNLVDAAKQAPNYSEKLSMSLASNSSTMKLTSDSKYFISEAIKVTINKSGNFAVAASQNVGAQVVNANGTVVTTVKNGDTVYLRMPADKISAGQTATVNMTVSGTIKIKSAYYYTPASSSIQKMIPAIIYTDDNKASATLSTKATKEKLPTEVVVSKQDITTSKELPGATLTIKDASGNVKATWVSSTTPKKITGLKAGNYTLCETAAPAGYILKTECIDFTVKDDGSVTKVTMYNQPETTTTEVIISKQDLSTKQELAGAELVIKDSEGNVKVTLTTDGKPKSIKGLKAGIYTIEETKAPDGYILSTKKLTFEVKEDGTTTKVVFYNEKKPEEIIPNKIKISKQDIATKTELPGATLIIRDSEGNEIKRWVSTNEAQYFELEAGTYTLEEIQAPNGYILSTEKIEFTVNEDGTVDKEVIMYNTREVEVPITASSVSILVYAIGLFGMIFGFTKVAKNAK